MTETYPFNNDFPLRQLRMRNRIALGGNDHQASFVMLHGVADEAQSEMSL